MGRMRLGNQSITLRLPPEIIADIKKVSALQHGRGLSTLVAQAWELSRAQIVGESKPKRAVRS